MDDLNIGLPPAVVRMKARQRQRAWTAHMAARLHDAEERLEESLRRRAAVVRVTDKPQFYSEGRT